MDGASVAAWAQQRLYGDIALRRLRHLPMMILGCIALAPQLAWAMRQCPPEFGEKSTAFWLMGWAVFALFVIAGVLLPILMFRATRQARPLLRWSLRVASFPAMLALWMLGTGIFFGKFVLSC